MSANRKTEINIGFISPSKQYEKLSKCLFEIKKTPQQINIQSPNIMIKIKKSGYFNK